MKREDQIIEAAKSYADEPLRYLGFMDGATWADGDTLNCVLDNLYLISQAKQVRKNYDDLPAERKAETRRKMENNRNNNIRRDQLRLRWGLEPLGRLVKRVR